MKTMSLLISLLVLSMSSFAAQTDHSVASTLDQIAVWQNKHPLPTPTAHPKKCVIYYAGQDLAALKAAPSSTILV